MKKKLLMNSSKKPEHVLDTMHQNWFCPWGPFCCKVLSFLPSYKIHERILSMAKMHRIKKHHHFEKATQKFAFQSNVDFFDQICILRWLLAPTEENRVHSERYQAKHLSLDILLLLKWGKFLNYLTLLKSNYLQPPRSESAAERKILSSIQIWIIKK